MQKERMTIHRALAELKLIDSRIEKATAAIDPTGGMQGEDGLVNQHYKKEEFETAAKAKLQSVLDLIARKIKIKSAIVNANGVTKVKIAEKEMTIADAINYKSLVSFQKNLIGLLLNKHNKVKALVNKENERVNEVALTNAKIMIGKPGDEKVKPTDEDVKAIMEPFIKRHAFHLIDPLKVEDLTEQLQKEVDSFEIEVDAVLSEINATTFIEIE